LTAFPIDLDNSPVREADRDHPRLFAEQERAKGKSGDQIKAEIDDGYKSGRFKATSKPGIVYMLSDNISLLVQDKTVHVPPHVMFYAP
jgi:hypothetical protein